jgi:predicted TIM-barrel fold metal-dependent hydrolase
MDVSALRVIDVDTHVIEPHDLWTSRVSTKKWGDLVPYVRWDEERKEEIWVSGDEFLCTVGGAAQAGWSEAPPDRPSRLGDVDPSLWRAEDRLALMDKYGIYAQVLYPNVGVAGFGGGRFAEVSRSDPEFALACMRAYNDFLTDFAAADPKRFIPVMALPFWDTDLSIAEMERCKAAGHRAILFSQKPSNFGQPMLGDRHWDRLFGAAQELELPVSFHIGSSGDLSGMQLLPEEAGPHANYAVFPATFFMDNAKAIATVIGAGVCHRFPRLKFVSVESGVGWLPFLVQALDWMWTECHVADEHPEYELLPSEYFRRQIYGCFWFEHGTPLEAAIEVLGPDNLLYETDFPHPTSMSPGPASKALVPRDFIQKNLTSLPDDVLRKLLQDNAAKLYQLTV